MNEEKVYAIKLKNDDEHIIVKHFETKEELAKFAYHVLICDLYTKIHIETR